MSSSYIRFAAYFRVVAISAVDAKDTCQGILNRAKIKNVTLDMRLMKALTRMCTI